MAFKKGLSRIKSSLKQEQLARRQIKNKTKAALLRERQKQSISLAVKKEQIRASTKLQSFKRRQLVRSQIGPAAVRYLERKGRQVDFGGLINQPSKTKKKTTKRRKRK